MSLASNRAMLVTVTKDFLLRWRQARENWKDEKSREFERLYMEELLASVDHAAEVIDQLDKILTKVRNDCE